MNKQISITVGGTVHSGKTHVVAAIFNVLETAGLLANVTVTGVDDSAQAFGEACTRVANGSLSEVLKDVKIEIVEHYGDRPAEASADATESESISNQQIDGVKVDTDGTATVLSSGDAESLEEEDTRPSNLVPLIPILRPKSAGYFVSEDLFPAREAIVVDGQAPVRTSFLQFGKKLDLMGISFDESLLENGVIDQTDSIDPAIGLKEIAWDNKGQPMVSLVENIVTSSFIATTGSNYRDMTVNFRGTLPFQGDNQVIVEVTGLVNLEMGTAELHAKVVESSLPEADWPVPVGYNLNVNRTNLNRR